MANACGRLGRPTNCRLCMGLAGERRLKEFELSHLPGYEASRPVRVGNAAYEQFQLDVYGEIMNALYIAHHYQIKIDEDAWRMQCDFLTFLETAWEKPDDGIWEARSGARHFTESKVAAWVAFDRAVKLIEDHGLQGAAGKMASDSRQDSCGRLRAWLRQQTQHLRAVLWRQRARRGVAASAADWFLARQRSADCGHGRGDSARVDGRRAGQTLPPGNGWRNEGAFLPCTFWLVDCLVAMGRIDEARTIYERLLALCNDVGLLSEEYDAERRPHAGELSASPHPHNVDQQRFQSVSSSEAA